MKDVSEFYTVSKTDSRPIARCKECNRRRCRERARRISATFDASIYENQSQDATKWCPSCQQHKPLADFRRDRCTVDGLYSRCVKCDSFGLNYRRSSKRVDSSRVSATISQIVDLYESHPYCHYCKRPLEPHEVSIDHKTPLLGEITKEKTSIDNLAISCWDCNRLKWTMDEREFFDFLRRYREQLNSIDL